MQRKSITKNVCFTPNESASLLERAGHYNLSLSQYLADPSTMLYKMLEPISEIVPIKLVYDDGHVEFDLNKDAIPDRLKRRKVSYLGISTEENPFKPIYQADRLSMLTFVLEDESYEAII